MPERTHLNRQNLYKILTGKTKPGLGITMSIIKGLGFHLVPKTMKPEYYNDKFQS